jgi:RIO-like serine/threonine protein kinase
MLYILDLPIRRTVKHRTIYTSFNGLPCYVKYSRFPLEHEDIVREVEVYQHLMDGGCTLMPKLLGYVYEEAQPRRIIGLLIEAMPGRHAPIDDYSQCEKALRELHHFIVHGDINPYNIIISDNGPKFVDLFDTKDSAWEEQADQEMQLLMAALSEESGLGRPYSN